MNILLVGNGRWAQNYITTFSCPQFAHVKLQIGCRSNWKSLIDNRPDGVIVCTPPQSHVEIAKYALEKNVPVLIEKPVALSLAETKSLSQFTAPILVNHICLFSEGYQNLKNIVKDKQITKISSLGFNNGPIRDYSSLWDYGPHDLSMILDLVDEMPNNIIVNKLETETGELFNLQLQFNTLTSQSLVGNGGKKKVRKFKVEFDGLKLTYDDLCRPQNHSLPLNNVIQAFEDSINGYPDHRLGLGLSIEIAKILESCHNSIHLKA